MRDEWIIKPRKNILASKKFWFFIAFVVVLLDQLTKWWVVQTLGLYERRPIFSFFDLTLTYNTGAAFSILADHSGWQRWFLVAVACVASVILVFWMLRTTMREKKLLAGLGFILGGAIGNLIDRVLAGAVTDFVLLHWHQFYFPAFNVADMAISFGALLLLIDVFAPTKKNKANIL
jgi:signal peptidase II